MHSGWWSWKESRTHFSAKSDASVALQRVSSALIKIKSLYLSEKVLQSWKDVLLKQRRRIPAHQWAFATVVGDAYPHLRASFKFRSPKEKLRPHRQCSSLPLHCTPLFPVFTTSQNSTIGLVWIGLLAEGSDSDDDEAHERRWRTEQTKRNAANNVGLSPLPPKGAARGAGSSGTGLPATGPTPMCLPDQTHPHHHPFYCLPNSLPAQSGVHYSYAGEARYQRVTVTACMHPSYVTITTDAPVPAPPRTPGACPDPRHGAAHVTAPYHQRGSNGGFRDSPLRLRLDASSFLLLIHLKAYSRPYRTGGMPGVKWDESAQRIPCKHEVERRRRVATEKNPGWGQDSLRPWTTQSRKSHRLSERVWFLELILLGAVGGATGFGVYLFYEG
ncbi:hypothetical protein FA13DRAFT_1779611 [Coprinellus micaceus]|uniref:Uncharacterized protein n=1 Tax=Coprinellus micaceus TaxID=71717 RepID=A0A4Y7SGI4_COPMI|nr:hypothetical protein FA13DRAFT_1779611 [Coprinellus micaceus]